MVIIIFWGVYHHLAPKKASIEFVFESFWCKLLVKELSES